VGGGAGQLLYQVSSTGGADGGHTGTGGGSSGSAS